MPSCADRNAGARGRKSDLVLDTVLSLGGSTYICGSGDQKVHERYLDHEAFEAHGMRVEYMRYEMLPYPQLWGVFAPGLSVLDLGVDKVETFEAFKLLNDAIWGIVKGEFMKFSYGYPGTNVFRGDFEKCFAYEGLEQLGVIGQYQCGIFERIYGWLDGLGMKSSVSPQVNGCMMHTDGKCFREITFTFDK